MSTYAQLLKTPEWWTKREEVLAAAGYHCQECGKGLVNCPCPVCESGERVTHFEVHHRYYVRGRKPWEYPNEALMCLCRPCHEHATATTDNLKAIVGLLPRRELEVLLQQATKIARQWLLSQDEDARLLLKDMPTEVRLSLWSV